jgi:cystathionine beta-lyase
MEYDFDSLIDRRDSDSLKWHDARENDAIPMWVADMDFASPPCVLRAMRERVDHGVFGYSVPMDEVNQSVVAWAQSHYGWQIDREWIVWLPGLVPGLHVASEACAAAGEEVLTFVPVYPPFLSAPLARGRAIRTVPLTRQGGRWTISTDELDKAITSRTRLLLLCNPHNPVGRAFGYEELEEVAEMCQRHNLLVCSDEIHCDLILTSERHIPFASLNDEIANRTITLMSPAKTFNTTGLNCGFAVIPNDDLRQHFRSVASGMVPQPNGLGYAACRAAFEEGEAWRRALIDYLRGNRDLLESFLAERLPMFSMAHVEATYLAWIDTRSLGRRNDVSFFEKAGIQLSDGTAFGGQGFMRLNFGCPRERLRAALDRILQAVQTANK